MTRVVLGAVIVLLAGVAGWGWDPGGPIGTDENPLERESSFTIPASCVMWAEGDLGFSDVNPSDFSFHKRATTPGFIGMTMTRFLWVYLVTNKPVQLTGDISAYVGQGPCAKTLPTKWSAPVDKWINNGWVLVGGFPWSVAPAHETVTLGGCAAPGYYRIRFALQVTRDGYNDPADTYEATVTAVLTDL